MRGTKSQTATLVCPDNLKWPEALACENVDDCLKLKHGCGAFGMCIDLVNGYDCNCEEGYLRRRSSDGEIVCGGEHDQLCGGHTCGAYGICIDLQSHDAQFDTVSRANASDGGEAFTTPVRGEGQKQSKQNSYRCECTDGFYDNGMTCARLDCTALTDRLGAWSGGTLFGQEYTLACPEDAYVWGGSLRDVTISCSKKGVWPSRPVCISPERRARAAEFATFRFWLNVALAGCCVICGALAAGLTLGLTTLEPFDLWVILATRPEDLKKEEDRTKLLRDQTLARAILPVVRDRHLLLVTLLLFNTVANESLPIFLDEVVPSLVAIVLSVTVVLFCGEVLPSAIFTGPNQFSIVAGLIPLVRLLEAFFYVVAKPIALVLDRFIGEEAPASEAEGVAPKYSRAELRALLQLHGGERAPALERGVSGASGSLGASSEAGAGEGQGQGQGQGHGGHHESPGVLTGIELSMLNGVLGLNALPLLSTKYVSLDKCFILDAEERIADVLQRGALRAGPQALLVLREPPATLAALPREAAAAARRDAEAPKAASTAVKASHVLGCLLPRDLLRGDWVDEERVRALCQEPVLMLPVDLTALDALRRLSAAGSALALLCSSPYVGDVVGVISRVQLLTALMGQDDVQREPEKAQSPSAAPSPSGGPQASGHPARLKTQLTHRKALSRRSSRCDSTASTAFYGGELRGRPSDEGDEEEAVGSRRSGLLLTRVAPAENRYTRLNEEGDGAGRRVGTA